MSSRFELPQVSTFDINGSPQVSATLDFHNVGLLTDKDTYPTKVDADAGTNTNPNPVVANASGNFGNIWLVGDYDVTLTSSGGSTIWGPELTESNITASSGVSTNELTTATMAANTNKVYEVGDRVRTDESKAGNDGGGNYTVVTTASVTPLPTGAGGRDIITGTADPTISFVLKINSKIDIRQLGEVGDGSTDNSDGIQRAEALMALNGGGTIILSDGANSDYRVTKHAGTNDKWGINIKTSNITLKIEDGASLRRLSSDISTFALAFPILLIGVPDDDNVSSQIKKIKIKGGEFIGEDTRHSNPGQAVFDGRQAIWIKNTKGCKFYGTEYSNIDSSAIFEQSPGMFDQENSQFYNTTKCYKIKYINNDFTAVEHAVAGRALLHAITTKSDQSKIVHNSYEWCDVCVNSLSTYDEYDEDEDDTYTNSDLALTVKRTGKGLVINSNNIYNSSEHCFYLNGMAESCTGNTITVDNVTVCNTNQIQIRGRGIVCTGNEFVGVAKAVVVNTGAIDVTYDNNPTQAFADDGGGIINITSVGLTAYIDARSDFFQSYKPMRNIKIGGTVTMPTTAQTLGVGLRVFTDTVDANFPDGQIINLNINGLILDNPRKAILSIAPMLSNGVISNCIFNGKPFSTVEFGKQGTDDTSSDAAFMTDTTESFTVNALIGYKIKNTTDGSEATVTANTATTVTGTLSGGSEDDWDSGDAYQLFPPMNSECVLCTDDSLPADLKNWSFDNNRVHGFEFILLDDGGAGGAGTFDNPIGFRDNRFNFIQNYSTPAYKQPVMETIFMGNTGRFFLDRTTWFSSSAVFNSLSDSTADSEKKTGMLIVSNTDIRIFTDDAGTFKAI